MLSEFQQRDLWERWLAAEMRSNYFADRAHHYASIHGWITWGTLLSSSGAAITILSGSSVPQWIKPTLAIIAAGLSLLSLAKQFQKRSFECSELQYKWNRLAYEAESLWNDTWANDAEARLQEIAEKAAELSKAASTIPYNERVMLKWENQVLQHHDLQAAA